MKLLVPLFAPTQPTPVVWDVDGSLHALDTPRNPYLRAVNRHGYHYHAMRACYNGRKRVVIRLSMHSGGAPSAARLRVPRLLLSQYYRALLIQSHQLLYLP
jgi:hypothetical protein